MHSPHPSPTRACSFPARRALLPPRRSLTEPVRRPGAAARLCARDRRRRHDGSPSSSCYHLPGTRRWGGRDATRTAGAARAGHPGDRDARKAAAPRRPPRGRSPGRPARRSRAGTTRPSTRYIVAASEGRGRLSCTTRRCARPAIAVTPRSANQPLPAQVSAMKTPAGPHRARPSSRSTRTTGCASGSTPNARLGGRTRPRRRRQARRGAPPPPPQAPRRRRSRLGRSRRQEARVEAAAATPSRGARPRQPRCARPRPRRHDDAHADRRGPLARARPQPPAIAVTPSTTRARRTARLGQPPAMRSVYAALAKPRGDDASRRRAERRRSYREAARSRASNARLDGAVERRAAASRQTVAGLPSARARRPPVG